MSRRLAEPAGGGLSWYEWYLDAFAGEDPGVCDICGRKGLEHAYICLDGGEEVCIEHVRREEDRT